MSLSLGLILMIATLCQTEGYQSRECTQKILTCLATTPGFMKLTETQKQTKIVGCALE
jgi:hypothetical protein